VLLQRGHVSIPGVYVGFLDKVPMGAAMNKGLTLKMGQTHVKRYLPELLGKIDSGEIDPSFVITHNRPLEEGPELYRTFRDKEDGCIKVVLKPVSLRSAGSFALFANLFCSPSHILGLPISRCFGAQHTQEWLRSGLTLSTYACVSQARLLRPRLGIGGERAQQNRANR
jgi:hypothetical protein